MQAFRDFAEFDWIWSRLTPMTPFGREAKGRQHPLAEPVALERIWDQTAQAGRLMEDLEPVAFDRLRHHLGRLPRFPDEALGTYGEVELFEIKKFLQNYLALRALLPAPIREAFALPEAPEGLAELLDRGRQSAESFHLSDAYSQSLAEIRARLRETDQTLEALASRRARELEERFGLAFGDRPFLVVAITRLADWEQAQTCLKIEPHDEGRALVRPLPSAEEWELREAREGLLSRERVEEAAVLETLGEAVRTALPGLRACREALAVFDLALARARVARELGLVRPRIEGGPLHIEGGRFLPCEELCARLGLDYTPLDAEFSSSSTVISGANMGGKTVVLKTVAFLQLCAQMGLFVPAASFRTRVYRHLVFIGEGREGLGQGLSGFGGEIRQLVEALEDRQGGLMLLLDEFVRTTSSREGEALLGALLERMRGEPGVFILCSTHLRGLPRHAAVDFRRMAGLRRAAFGLAQGDGEDLEARIRCIDRLMDYRLVPDPGGDGGSDAVDIAEVLGLPVEIARRARELLKDGIRGVSYET